MTVKAFVISILLPVVVFLAIREEPGSLRRALSHVPIPHSAPGIG